MIDSLRLINFEIHKDTTLKFEPGVNFITGSSDNGKSSIRKALSWVIKNRPLGTSFVNRKELSSKVTVQLGRTRISREVTLTKSRNIKTNLYRVNRETFKALGTNIPEDVSTALQMDDTNVQSQFDQFFLLQDTPGQVAQKFNKVMGLDTIDRCLKQANAIVSKADWAVTQTREEIEKTETDLERFDDIAEKKKLIKRACELQDKIDSCVINKSSLNHLLVAGKEAEQTIENLNAKIVDTDFSGIIKQAAFVSELQSKIRSIKRHLSEHEATQETIQETLEWLDIEKDSKNLEKIAEKLRAVSDNQRSLKKRISSRTQAAKQLKQAQETLLEAETRMEEWKEEHALCPVCGGEWK